jgi:thiol-disulfide isomerase/thioredoxin
MTAGTIRPTAFRNGSTAAGCYQRAAQRLPAGDGREATYTPAMRAVLVGVLAGLLVSAAIVLGVILALPSEPLGRPPVVSPSPSPGTGPTSGASAGPSTTSTSGSASPTVSPRASGSLAVGLRVGDVAPPLALPRLGGGEIDVDALRGEPVWVNFTASWCPPCRDELPLMERIQGQLGERLTIIVVDVREDPDTVAALVSELGLTLPVGLDRDGRGQQAWGAYALPVHYWVDVDGRIRHFLYGGPGPDLFIEAVRTVLPDAEIDL